jgi:hypothetical protein
MSTLRFLGRPNDGFEIEWNHSHNHWLIWYLFDIM